MVSRLSAPMKYSLLQSHLEISIRDVHEFKFRIFFCFRFLFCLFRFRVFSFVPVPSVGTRLSYHQVKPKLSGYNVKISVTLTT